MQVWVPRGGQEKDWDTHARLQIHQPFSRRQGGGLDPFRAVFIDISPISPCFYVFFAHSGVSTFFAPPANPLGTDIWVYCVSGRNLASDLRILSAAKSTLAPDEPETKVSLAYPRNDYQPFRIFTKAYLRAYVDRVNLFRAANPPPCHRWWDSPGRRLQGSQPLNHRASARGGQPHEAGPHCPRASCANWTWPGKARLGNAHARLR